MTPHLPYKIIITPSEARVIMILFSLEFNQSGSNFPCFKRISISLWHCLIIKVNKRSCFRYSTWIFQLRFEKAAQFPVQLWLLWPKCNLDDLLNHTFLWSSRIITTSDFNTFAFFWLRIIPDFGFFISHPKKGQILIFIGKIRNLEGLLPNSEKFSKWAWKSLRHILKISTRCWANEF